MPIMNPSVHTGGTSRNELVQARRQTMLALRKAIHLMEETLPNGRDYIGRDHQFSLDRAIYRERYTALKTLIDSIEEEAIAIHKEGAAR